MMMSLKDRPLRRRSNAILSTEVHKYIHEFVSFLGCSAVSKAQRDLDKTLSHHGRCYQMWMQQLQKWLFTLRLYNQVSINGTQRSWPEQIQQTVGDAFMILSLVKKMPETVKEKYRKDLLTIQHSDFMFEIRTAWHYHLQGYDVEWYPLSHSKSTEFRVRGGGLDFDVECRRFTLDVGSRVKMGTMADICDMMDSVLQRCNYWGEVTVAFSDNLRFDPAQARLWQQAFKRAVVTGQTHLQLADGPLLTLKLEVSPSSKYTREELSRFVTASATTWIVSKDDGSSCFDPVVFRCQGVRKTKEELRDSIYKTLRKKVKTQLSGSRAGVVYVKFTGVKNPTVFNESEGMQAIIGKLFHHDHLAAIVFLCDEVLERDNGAIVHSSPSILFWNPKTSYPGVAAAKHLGQQAR